MNWYRVAVDNAGKVTSCDLVEKADVNAGGVYYVRAGSNLDAGKVAFRAYCAERLRVTRARLAAEGRCDCGAKRDTAHESCTRCLERHRLYKQRTRARRRGEKVEPLDRHATHKQRREEELEKARQEGARAAVAQVDDAAVELRVLLKVQRAWVQASTIGKFTAWLSEQIAKLQKGKAA